MNKIVKISIICLLAVVLIFAFVIILIRKSCDENEWHQFKHNFNRTFETKHEEEKREKIFCKTLQTIARHNVDFQHDKVSFMMGINKFADMTFKEFHDLYAPDFLSVKVSDDVHEKAARPVELIMTTLSSEEVDNVPKNFDWCDRGAVTKAKDQGTCGSCYAFAAIGALESRWYIETGNLTEFSVQEIIDCTASYLNENCQGGIVSQVIAYVTNHGINLATDYPYEGKFGNCSKKKNKINFKLKGYGIAIANDNSDSDDKVLKSTLVTQGPLAIFLNIDHESFMRYASGVYFEPKCGNRTTHASLLVGYENEGDQAFWIVKNSFGSQWGEDGFIKIARNKGNDCAVRKFGVFPVTESIEVENSFENSLKSLDSGEIENFLKYMHENSDDDNSYAFS